MSHTFHGDEWWTRSPLLAEYKGINQGERAYCVFASIAGAVNHLLGKDVWSMDTLAEAHAEKGGTIDLSAANTAVAPIDSVLSVWRHHVTDTPGVLSPPVIRGLLKQPGVVILSLPVTHSDGSFGGWHMLSVVAEAPGVFQVWDSNGYAGLLEDAEIMQRLQRPPGGFGWLNPHPQQDAIAIIHKDKSVATLQ